MDSVQEIKSKAEFDEIIAHPSGRVALVDFGADWCDACVELAVEFERLASEHHGNGVAFYNVNADVVPDAFKQAKIGVLPTFHAYKAGSRIDTLELADRARLTAFVNRHFK